VLGSDGWLRMDYPLAQAQPTRCHIFIGDASSFGGFETSTVSFEPVNQYMLQAERFSRFLLGEPVPTWPIEDARSTLQIIDALFESARKDRWVPVGAATTGSPARLESGDRVVAARDIDTTQGIHIVAGTEGTIAEDRGSNLVVFFEEEPKLTSVEKQDVRKLAE
jgi:hypothetical protein